MARAKLHERLAPHRLCTRRHTYIVHRSMLASISGKPCSGMLAKGQPMPLSIPAADMVAKSEYSLMPIFTRVERTSRVQLVRCIVAEKRLLAISSSRLQRPSQVRNCCRAIVAQLNPSLPPECRRPCHAQAVLRKAKHCAHDEGDVEPPHMDCGPRPRYCNVKVGVHGPDGEDRLCCHPAHNASALNPGHIRFRLSK
jgi:hypothetical protein